MLRGATLIAIYTYDYRGLRTRKVTTAAAPQGAQVVRYLYDEAWHLLEEVNATGAAIRTYVWADDRLYAQIDHVPSRKIIYFELDHLGTPRAALNQSGTVVWTWESDAFGAIPPNQNPSGLGVEIVNLRFPGQYYDQETGLYYNMHRYYDPTMGQYVQPDLIGLKGGSFSTYTYVRNNPLKWADPMGLTVYIVGNTPSEYSALQHSYDNVAGTQRGAQLINMMETSSTIYTITNEQDNNAYYNPKTNTISVDPNFHPAVSVGTGAQCSSQDQSTPQPASTDIILGHELGHAATGTLDDGPNNMNNVNQNENPIRSQLGLPPRTAY